MWPFALENDFKKSSFFRALSMWTLKKCGYLNMTLIPLINNSPWIPCFPLMLPFRIPLLSLSMWVRTTALPSNSCHNRKMYKLAPLHFPPELQKSYLRLFVFNWWRKTVSALWNVVKPCDSCLMRLIIHCDCPIQTDFLVLIALINYSTLSTALTACLNDRKWK